jgi:hypothetical protein
MRGSTPSATTIGSTCRVICCLGVFCIAATAAAEGVLEEIREDIRAQPAAYSPKKKRDRRPRKCDRPRHDDEDQSLLGAFLGGVRAWCEGRPGMGSLTGARRGATTV